MKINAATLANAVRTVLPATKAGHLPVLKGVYLNVCFGVLDVLATDIDLRIGTSVLDVEGDLKPTVVPAALLAGWLDGVDGDVVLEHDDADLVCRSDTGTMRLRTLPVEDWPATSVTEADPVPLDRRVAGILYAASRDGARPILNGVGIGDGWACCTDSYQLSAVRLEGLADAIIPVRLLDLALKAEGDATIAVDDRKVTVTVGPTTYTGRLIEGTFPNWRPLVGEPATTVTLDRERCIAALERVMVLADNIETPVRITPEGEGLAFTVVSRDVGEIVERVDGGTELGATYGFRPRLLIGMLRSRDEAKVELGITDSLHPVSVRDDTSVALVMPVRL